MQEAITRIVNRSEIHRSKYRLEIVSEILHYGRAACENNTCLQHQIEAWSVALARIPADKLFYCYSLTSRRREKRFDDEPLAAYELLAAWRELKTNNQE